MKYKIPIITFISLILLVIISSTSALADANWPSFQYDIRNSGQQDTSFVGSFNETSTYSELGFGVSYQPIVADWDADGTNEIIGSSNSLLMIYNVSSNGLLQLENSFNMGTPQTGIGFYGVFSGINKYIVSFGNITYALRYDGSSLNKSINNSITTTPTRGITCDSFANGTVCFQAIGTNNISEFNPTTGAIAEYNVSSIVIPSLLDEKMAFNDFDSDGDTELIFYCTVGAVEGVCVVSQTLIGSFPLDTGFSTDGFYPFSGTFCDYGGITVGNFEQGFGNEICLSYGATSGTCANGGGATKNYIDCVDFQGTNIVLNSIFLSAAFKTEEPSAPFVGDFNTSAVGNEVCVIVRNDGASVNNLVSMGCVNGWDGNWKSVFDKTQTTHPDLTVASVPTVADMDNDGDSDVLYEGSIIYTEDGAIESIFNISTSISVNTEPIPVDINGDDNLDICGQIASEVFCAISTFSNDIPTLTNNFGRTFDNPVCNGTTLRFSAKEYDESITQLTGTNYYNDVDTDTERLVIDCYGNGTLTTGDYSLANPFADCVYNTPDIYYAIIYIEDSFNTGDRTQLEEETVYVITGTDCNDEIVDIGEESIEGTPITTTTTNPTATGTANFIDTLTGGDNNSKIFIGFMIWLIIVISLMVGVATITASGVAVAAIGVIGGLGAFIVLTALGILPIWLLILFFLGLILLVILKVGFMGNGGS